MIRQLVSQIDAAADFVEILQRLEQFEVDERFLKEISSVLQEAMQVGEALGRSLIVEKDRLQSEGQSLAGKFDAADWFICDDKVVRVAFNLVPKEALDYIRYKALTIAGVESGKVLNAVKIEIQRAIQQGITLQEFKARVDTIFESYGVTKLSNRHIETVFRTNIFTSYSIGQMSQVNEMTDRFPLWQYSAVRDSRTRPDHLELDGRIFRTGEGPIPPIDYNCRCTAIYLHISKVQTQNLWKRIEGAPGPALQRFNTRDAFHRWLAQNSTDIPPSAAQWIQQNG